MTTSSFDVTIIGGGPGGYVAAIRAAQLGLRTALVEKEHLGGICLNWGCIPTKALLRSADVLRLIRDSASFGIQCAAPTVDLAAIVKRSRGISAQLQRGVKHLMQKNGVQVFNGHGKLGAPAASGLNIVVEQADGSTQSLHTKDLILATGARARTLPMFPVDGQSVWSYKEALVPTSVPKSLTIIGAGVIGIEFASFYRALGSEVHVVEMGDRILASEDGEVSQHVAKALQRDGIQLHLGCRIQDAKKQGQGWTLQLEGAAGAQSLQADVVLVAAGIVGNTEKLGLENYAVKVENTHIITQDFSATGHPHIYAIGDVAAAPWLAHKASHEAVICVEHIAGLKPHPLNADRIPACIYSHPQVAHVGLTEEQAKASGRTLRIGKFPLAANGKALAMGSSDGFIKVIFDDQSGELLGAHMVGDEVTELIQGYGIAMQLETTEAELMQTVFAHPTLSESMHEAVLDAYQRALHY